MRGLGFYIFLKISWLSVKWELFWGRVCGFGWDGFFYLRVSFGEGFSWKLLFVIYLVVGGMYVLDLSVYYGSYYRYFFKFGEK